MKKTVIFIFYSSYYRLKTQLCLEYFLIKNNQKIVKGFLSYD